MNLHKFALLNIRFLLLLLSVMPVCFSCSGPSKEPLNAGTATQSPRIVNIVNFIRLLEPRDEAITEDVLYQTVVKQLALMRQYHLPGTFLLQYDALMDKRYQQLLKTLPADSFEIGGWWEIPQPLVEKAGMHWRGRYPWDWHADVGFSTGYTPAEREKLIDVYMEDFKTIFGRYPQSVGSWFIDAHSLAYMHEKYQVVASSNCKDQYGTDGYTMWGGYWNQAYYPSIYNAYMPAQDAETQIPVPIFRMLGSDPIRQYENGLGGTWQGVETLEPVYPAAGGDATWVHWFFERFTQEETLGFNYTQAGQENSFTWSGMEKGLQIQFPLIAALRDEGKLRVETLLESAQWFRKNFPVTPATTFAISEDLPGKNRKTFWYNNRFYRVNLLWDSSGMQIRDMHLFDEQLHSPYLDSTATTNECKFFTLPVMDGYVWSDGQHTAGMQLMATVNGKEQALHGGQPRFTNVDSATARVDWPLADSLGNFQMTFSDTGITATLQSDRIKDWYFSFRLATNQPLPFQSVDSSTVYYVFEQIPYRLKVHRGSCRLEGRELRLDSEESELAFQLLRGRGNE